MNLPPTTKLTPTGREEKRIPLHEFTDALISQVVEGIRRFEENSGGEWRVSSFTVTPRVGLKYEVFEAKPAQSPKYNVTLLNADLDEPDRLLTEIPIPVQRFISPAEKVEDSR